MVGSYSKFSAAGSKFTKWTLRLVAWQWDIIVAQNVDYCRRQLASDQLKLAAKRLGEWNTLPLPAGPMTSWQWRPLQNGVNGVLFFNRLEDWTSSYMLLKYECLNQASVSLETAVHKKLKQSSVTNHSTKSVGQTVHPPQISFPLNNNVQKSYLRRMQQIYLGW